MGDARDNPIGLGLVFGVVLGIVVGPKVFGDPSTGIAVGISMGLAIGVAFRQSRQGQVVSEGPDDEAQEDSGR